MFKLITYIAYLFLHDWLAILHFLFISLAVDTFRAYVPKGLTFAESLSFFTVIGNFLAFYLESAMMSYRGNGKFIAGNNAHNILMFSPVS